MESLAGAAAFIWLCKNLLVMLTGSISNSSFELFMPYTEIISTAPADPFALLQTTSIATSWWHTL